ncbi:isocitrate/isopropylmalate dehydrogenase family protein [Streptomyces sp. SP18CS02]|uniref:isocitrate/isopropylmalate dehydrogenase family protein n=1 Tax=Streptomyces sp. SP18CS02 TaxID=3002531 RepID=UPI002E79395A|nr:isocitrate/isopropylmalate family dehydrogenase [Streptomyces sp. SP18CS02]MEE1756444.1 isocitrate/isopropylmalate family dehydrogenase [Streptomyces sp. SP18CS02]
MTAPVRLAVIPGDGIGAEVTVQARQVLDEVSRLASIPLEYDEIPAGAAHYLEHGRDWPEGSERRCADADAILLGAIGLPDSAGRGSVLRTDGRMAGWSAIVGNRIGLDLYANVRPVKLFPGVRHRVSGRLAQVWEPSAVDMVMVRENTEGLYSGSGGVLAPGGLAQVATDTRIITRTASERVIRYAFETAMRRDGAPADGRRRVTCVVKDNILHGCRLFLDVFEEVAAAYPDVERDVSLVDAFTLRLVRDPGRYDVVVSTNMFGDIITELASALQGGLGLSVGCNIGDRHAMFEPIHGSAPGHTGQDRVNPMAALLAAGEALSWVGERRGDPALTGAGGAVARAVRDVLADGSTLTYDLADDGRAAPSSKVTAAVVHRLPAALEAARP